MKDGKRRRPKQPAVLAAPKPVERVLSLGNSRGKRHVTSTPSAQTANRLQELLKRDFCYAGARTKSRNTRVSRMVYGDGYIPSEFHRYEPRFPSKLGGGGIRTLFHGTSVVHLEGILNNGLRPSRNGLLGPGIYFGGREKAEAYFRSDEAGVLLECQVRLGRTFDAIPRANGAPPGYDSVRGVPGVTVVWGGTLLREEFTVPDKSQVAITAIWLFKGDELRCGRCAKQLFVSQACRGAPKGVGYAWLCKACA